KVYAASRRACRRGRELASAVVTHLPPKLYILALTPILPLLADGEDGDGRPPEDALRRRAEEELLERGAPVRAHDDERGLQRRRPLHDDVRRPPPAELRAGGAAALLDGVGLPQEVRTRRGLPLLARGRVQVGDAARHVERRHRLREHVEQVHAGLL